MHTIISNIDDVVVQIATPYSTASGVYLGEFNVIVTNEHVVKGFKKVTINGLSFPKQEADVLFIDTHLDIAFISIPTEHSMPIILLDHQTQLKEGDSIIAAGHPFDLAFTATQGIISSLNYFDNKIQYIQHDAALNPGNSGGPLVSIEGKIIGLNTFIFEKGKAIGFALPASYIHPLLTVFIENGRKSSIKCPSCHHMCIDNMEENEFCDKCGGEIVHIRGIVDYQPKGMSWTIENLITQLGFDVALTRKGPLNWELKQGSSTIQVSYYEKTGLLTGDALICSLPDDKIVDLYQYLLQQNSAIEGLTFAIKGNDVYLSMLVFDQFMKIDVLKKLFGNLLAKADELDNFIIEKFGAKQV